MFPSEQTAFSGTALILKRLSRARKGGNSRFETGNTVVELTPLQLAIIQGPVSICCG